SPPLHIQDVFPLMCVLAGLPVPGGLSGELPAGWAAAAPERDAAWDWREQVQGPPLPQAANPDMLARLAELGYL
ncbi:MAG TPA: hypothetical protein VKM72_20735, partial [Thermoanaerobaculia bacterium]|nr:hypothetical protein [Thermoanaerobaculia bacterium]